MVQATDERTPVPSVWTVLHDISSGIFYHIDTMMRYTCSTVCQNETDKTCLVCGRLFQVQKRFRNVHMYDAIDRRYNIEPRSEKTGLRGF